MQDTKRISSTILALLIIGASFSIGTYFGMTQRPAIEKITGLTNKQTGQPTDVDFGSFWKAWSILEEKHVSKEKIDDQALIYGAIQGMVHAVGDPYTVFFPPQEQSMFQSEIKGEFGGIGAEIGVRKDIITVIAPIKGSPAQAAGIMAGDKVLKIDDKVTNDLSLEQAVSLIRGPKNSEVALTLLRGEEAEPRVINVKRDTIKLPIIDTEKKGDVYVISLHSFSENSATEFRRAVSDFKNSGTNKLIIDLRNNPGGYLESAVDIASWFLDNGQVVVTERFGNGKEVVHRSNGYTGLENARVAVLIDQGSASASEILAGALRDQKHIPLIGMKSFGKGSVQELVPITDKTSLKVTIAKWLTPSGKSISEEGLDPDYRVELKKEDVEAGKDLQMERALELLK